MGPVAWDGLVAKVRPVAMESAGTWREKPEERCIIRKTAAEAERLQQKLEDWAGPNKGVNRRE